MTQTSAESAPVDLSDLTKPQLIELAAHTGLTIPPSLPKPKVIERMMTHQLEATVRPKIGVVGFAEGHLIEAPFDDDGWELWGINRLHTLPVAKDKKFHAWFNLHDLNKFHGKDVEHLEFLQNFDGPVYLRPDDIGKYEIPNQTPFPADEMVERFGRYFNNTISWLLAFAITRNPIELGVYGVDMAQDMLMNAEYCLSGQTRILTADLRWVPAEQVKVGDELVAFDEHPQESYREFRTTTVESVTELMQPSYRFHMADGTKLVSSDKHRWLHGTDATWHESSDLHGPIMNKRLAQEVRSASEHMSSRQIEARYGISRSATQRVLTDNLDWEKCRRDTLYKVLEPWDEDRSRDAGYLAAAFDGEGHLSMTPRKNHTGYNVSLGFAQRDNEMGERVEQALTDRGFDYSVYEGDTRKYQVKGGRKEIMRLLGSLRPHRLLGKFNPDRLGVMHKTEAVEIVDREFIGQAPVVGIQTTAGTFIAEGFASHNSQQRPSCEYFLGIASGLGIGVTLPKGSDLLKSTHLYGFEDADPFTEKAMSRLQEVGQRKEQAKGQLAQVEGQRQELVNAINQLDGAMQDTQYWLRNWVPQPLGDIVGESTD